MKMEQAKRFEEELNFQNIPQKQRFWLTNLVRFHGLLPARADGETCYLRKMTGVDFFGEPLYIGLHLQNSELLLSTFLERQEDAEKSKEDKMYELASDLESAVLGEDSRLFQETIRKMDKTLGQYSGCKAFL